MPYTTPDVMPKRITGPATVKILAPTPRMIPSLFESIASEVTALEKPVTGTKVPAPAFFAITSKRPNPVRMEARKIKKRVVSIGASLSLAPR